MKFQFSLSTLFKWVTGSAVMCAVVVGLVAALGGSGAIAFLVAVLATSCAVWGGWYADRQILKCPRSARLLLTLVLLGISVWLITLIQLAFWLEVPGAYGPVQYWGGSASGFMALRGVTLLFIFPGLLLAAAVLLSTFNSFVVAESALLALRQGVVPAVALAAYALAYWMFVAYGFFPSA